MLVILLAAKILLLLNKANSDLDDLKADYYKKLIVQNTQKAKSYNLTDRNEKFEKGANSEKIEDYPEIFDYVIVGAGTAGAVLATRLSENPNIRIAVIEAGGEEDDFSRIPNMATTLQFSEKNWGYYSTPQTKCCQGMVKKKCNMPRGRVLGGSSSISVGIYRRSSRINFNEWASKGFSYPKALFYYKYSENSQVEDSDHHYHGKGGLLNVETPKPDSSFESIVRRANKELNVPYVDYNGKYSVGYSKPQVTIKRGERQSTNTAFLDYARARENLRVITNALVIKVVLKSKVAQGVIFITNDKKYKIEAKTEVILSAGPINTPQLLMLSGIGPEEHLKDKHIKVKQNLPVGAILRDKILYPLIVRTNVTEASNSGLDTLIRQLFKGEGALVKPLYTDVMDFIHTEDAPKGAPMFECLVVPPGRNQSPILQRVFNYNDEIAKAFLKQINTTTDFAFDLILTRPKSAGSVTLKSADPIDFPNVDVNYFSDPADIDHFIKGIEFFAKKLIQTKAFREINATLQHFVCHGKEGRERHKCAIETLATSAFEPSETTPIGSVVNRDFQVIGIQKLRIVDAGVFSNFISTEADTIMLAEKVAHLLKFKRAKES